jgi:AcrR family transcriptional regulator
MGSSERRQRHRDEIRTRVLDAARELFASEGFEAVTMRRIAERIEYTPTAIYFHFRDKNALIRELCDRDFLALADEFARLAEESDPLERLRRAARAYARFAKENPNHYRLMYMTPGLPPTRGHSRIERGNPRQDAYAFLEQAVEQAIEQKLLRPELRDAGLVAQTLWAGIHGVISLEIALSGDDWTDFKAFGERIDLMLDVLLRGIERRRG